jgi:hypothetical protein
MPQGTEQETTVQDTPQQLMYKHTGRPFEHVTWDLPAFIDENFFSGKKKTYGLRSTHQVLDYKDF